MVRGHLNVSVSASCQNAASLKSNITGTSVTVRVNMKKKISYIIQHVVWHLVTLKTFSNKL